LDDGGAIISKSENPASSPAPLVFLGCLLPGILCNDGVLKLDYASSPSSSRSPVPGGGDEDIELGLSVDTSSPGAEFTVTGDPTETCIMTVAAQLSSPDVVERLIKQNNRLDEIPFDSTSKYMATLHTINAKLYRLMVNSTTEDSFKSLPGIYIIICCTNFCL
jgi:magnesium-transporting ATPase (P-type)